MAHLVKIKEQSKEIRAHVLKGFARTALEDYTIPGAIQIYEDNILQVENMAFTPLECENWSVDFMDPSGTVHSSITTSTGTCMQIITGMQARLEARMQARLEAIKQAAKKTALW